MGVRSATLAIIASFKGVLTNILKPGSTARPSVAHEFKEALNFANGTGPNQVNFAYGDNDRALLDGVAETIDLFDLGTLDIGAGAGADALGQPLALVELVTLYIKNKGPGRLKLGGEGSAAAFQQLFRDTAGASSGDEAALSIEPNGSVLLTAPNDPAYPVTDTSDHLLQIQAVAGAGAITYDIGIAGRTA